MSEISPSRAGLWRELLGVRELPPLVWRARDLSDVPRGAGAKPNKPRRGGAKS